MGIQEKNNLTLCEKLEIEKRKAIFTYFSLRPNFYFRARVFLLPTLKSRATWLWTNRPSAPWQKLAADFRVARLRLLLRSSLKA